MIKPKRASGVSISCLVNASCTAVPTQFTHDTVDASSSSMWNQSDSDGCETKIYAFGGFHFYTDEVFNDLFVLSTSDLIWRRIHDIRGPWPCKRCDHTATLWGSDKLVFFGGRDSNDTFLNDIYILDLTRMTWDRPQTFGPSPTGRSKHSANIYNNCLYIYGGWETPDSIANSLNILNLLTMTWSSPISVIPRHSHFANAYKSRLYIYGGTTAALDPATDLLMVDLSDMSQCSLRITGQDTPPPLGQHFAQLVGDQLVVLVTESIRFGGDVARSASTALSTRSRTRGHQTPPDIIEPSNPLEGDQDIVPTGIWSLSLESMRWRRHDEGRYLGTSSSWYYCAMAHDHSHMFLFGNGMENTDAVVTTTTISDGSNAQTHRGVGITGGEAGGGHFGGAGGGGRLTGGNIGVGAGADMADDNNHDDDDDDMGGTTATLPHGNTMDEYMGTVLDINLEIHGLFKIPESQCPLNFEALLPFNHTNHTNNSNQLQIAPPPQYTKLQQNSNSTWAAALTTARECTDLAIKCLDDTPSTPAIPVHRLVLLARWPHYASLERSGMSESTRLQTQTTTTTNTLPHVVHLQEPRELVLAFLYHLYTDTLPPPPRQQQTSSSSTTPLDLTSHVMLIADMLPLADMYCMDRLKRLCSCYLHAHLSIKSVARVYARAHQARESGLKLKALRMILDRFGAVVKTDEFLWLMLEGRSSLGARMEGHDSGSVVGTGACSAAFKELWESVPADSKLSHTAERL